MHRDSNIQRKFCVSVEDHRRDLRLDPSGSGGCFVEMCICTAFRGKAASGAEGGESWPSSFSFGCPDAFRNLCRGYVGPGDRDSPAVNTHSLVFGGTCGT